MINAAALKELVEDRETRPVDDKLAPRITFEAKISLLSRSNEESLKLLGSISFIERLLALLPGSRNSEKRHEESLTATAMSSILSSSLFWFDTFRTNNPKRNDTI